MWSTYCLFPLQILLYCHKMTAPAIKTNVRLFGKWSAEDVKCADLSLQDYITLKPIYLPHSSGRWSKKRFRKAKCPVVERLTCSIMMHGRNNGKKIQACRIVRHAFEIMYLMTDSNPLQVCKSCRLTR